MEDDRVNFCLDVLADEKSVFGRQLSGDAEDSYVQAYTSYMVDTGRVDDTLDIAVRSSGEDIVIEEAVRLDREAAALSPENVPEEHEDNGPPPESPVPDSEPPETQDEAPPTVAWSKRYKEARRLLTGGGKTPSDFEKARLLLLEEAQAGNALAMFDLGRISSAGIGQDPDGPQAQGCGLLDLYCQDMDKRYRCGLVY